MEKQDALISVIVPVYNVQDYLERCINSIWQQTYRNLEIILVDDGSTDHSGKMCDAFAAKDSRIKVIHKKNGGLSDARNAGLAQATGEYIGYVDSDDWIEPQMYDTMYRACKVQNAEVAICRYQGIYEGAVREKGSGEITPLTQEALLQAYICGDDKLVIYNSVWCKLFKKELVEGTLFPKGRNSEDIMYTTRAFCKAQKAVFVDSFFYNYVQDRAGSIMNEKRTERMFRDELPFWREHIACIRENVSQEMGDKAAYHYYRRLLFYYMDLKKEKNTQAAGKIADECRQMKKEIARIYGQTFVASGDKVRMKCMLLSPTLYYLMDCFYNKVVIPIRTK